MSVFPYPGQGNFGDTAHVGYLYALLMVFLVDVGNGEILTSSCKDFGRVGELD